MIIHLGKQSIEDNENFGPKSEYALDGTIDRDSLKINDDKIIELDDIMVKEGELHEIKRNVAALNITVQGLERNLKTLLTEK